MKFRGKGRTQGRLLLEMKFWGITEWNDAMSRCSQLNCQFVSLRRWRFDAAQVAETSQYTDRFCMMGWRQPIFADSVEKNILTFQVTAGIFIVPPVSRNNAVTRK